MIYTSFSFLHFFTPFFVLVYIKKLAEIFLFVLNYNSLVIAPAFNERQHDTRGNIALLPVSSFMFPIHLVNFLLNLLFHLFFLLILLLERIVQALKVLDIALHSQFLRFDKIYLQRFVKVIVVNGLLAFFLTDFVGLCRDSVNEF